QGESSQDGAEPVDAEVDMRKSDEERDKGSAHDEVEPAFPVAHRVQKHVDEKTVEDEGEKGVRAGKSGGKGIQGRNGRFRSGVPKYGGQHHHEKFSPGGAGDNDDRGEITVVKDQPEKQKKSDHGDDRETAEVGDDGKDGVGQGMARLPQQGVDLPVETEQGLI